MQPNPAEAMEVFAPPEGEAPKDAGPWLGFWEVSRRRLTPDDPFFAAGDMERELLAKHVALDLSDDDRYQLEKMDVASVRAQPSQRHRQKYHRRQTAYKGEETRDTVMDVDGKNPRQSKTRYRPRQRDHKEPKENEHDGKESKENEHDRKEPRENENHQKEAKESDMEVEQKIDELSSAVSRLSTADSVPSSVTFGHRRARGLTFVPRSIRQNKQASQPEAN